MKKILLLAIFSIGHFFLLAQVTIALEDFDGTSTWTNDAADKTFVDPSSSDQGLFIQAGSDLGPDMVLYGSDLQNESGEPDLNPVTITFSPVDVTGHNSVVLSFMYHLNGFDSTDKLEYNVFVDGISVEMGELGGSAVGTYTYNVANGSGNVSLVITLTQNGANDSFELDDFKVEGVVIMPVEFTSIQATAKSKSVNVTWETASEINNEMFVIERASDARNFEAIGKVAGQGNSTTVQSYSFEDLAPVAGTNYYRIKQVDFDGAYENSEVVAVEMDKVSNIRVVPTATYNWADIYATGSKSVAVYSMSGELMTSITSEEGAYQIDLNDWAQGVYLVQINYGSYTETAKLIRL